MSAPVIFRHALMSNRYPVLPDKRTWSALIGILERRPTDHEKSARESLSPLTPAHFMFATFCPLEGVIMRRRAGGTDAASSRGGS